MKKFAEASKQTLKFIFLLVLVILSFCYAMFQGGFVSWFLFGSFLPIALYCFALFFYPVKKIHIQREINKYEFQAGEQVVVNLTFSRTNHFPIFFCLIEDDISINFKEKYGSSLKFLLFPLFKKQWTYTYQLEQIPRGEYELKGYRVVIGDPFGLVRKGFYVSDEDKILVYPAFINMTYEPFENQFELGMTATKDKVQRDSTMAISVREYVPGDKFSWIHWKQSAKKNEIMTKEFEQRQSHDVMLVLDRTPHPNFELSVFFTASIIRSVLKKGAQVGLVSMGERTEYFPMKSGKFQLRTLNYHLARVEDDASIEFSKMLELEQTFKSQHSLIFFIVNQLSLQVVEKISSLSVRRGHLVLFVVMSKNEKLNNEQLELIDLARKRGIVTRVIYEDAFAKAFDRG